MAWKFGCHLASSVIPFFLSFAQHCILVATLCCFVCDTIYRKESMATRFDITFSTTLPRKIPTASSSPLLSSCALSQFRSGTHVVPTETTYPLQIVLANFFLQEPFTSYVFAITEKISVLFSSIHAKGPTPKIEYSSASSIHLLFIAFGDYLKDACLCV